MKASLLMRALPAAVIFAGLAGAPLASGLAQTSSTTPTPSTGASTPGAPTANSTMGTQAPGGTMGSQTPSGTSSASSAPMPHGSGSANATSGTTKPPSHATATNQSTGKPAQGRSIQALVDQRIKDLHGRLHITAAQQPKWDQFAQAMRGNAQDLDAAYRQRAEKLDKMNAIDNMQSYAQIEQKRAQDAEKLIPAFQGLYDALSDTQKKEADSLFRNYAAQAQQRRAAGTQTGSR